MSTITHHLLQAVNVEAARVARNKNFAYLRRFLDKTNALDISPDVDGPHCYPYFPTHPVRRKYLIEHRVFVPTYWLDVLSRAKDNSFEVRLVNQCLPIPCDQRYNEIALSRVLSLL